MVNIANSPQILEIGCGTGKRPGAIGWGINPLTLRSPWAFIDPAHRRYFSVDSFGSCDPGDPISRNYPYWSARFRPEQGIFNENIPTIIGKGLIKWLSNRWSGRYERLLGHIFTLDDQSFYLRVIK